MCLRDMPTLVKQIGSIHRIAAWLAGALARATLHPTLQVNSSDATALVLLWLPPSARRLSPCGVARGHPFLVSGAARKVFPFVVHGVPRCAPLLHFPHHAAEEGEWLAVARCGD